jgi:integrase
MVSGLQPGDYRQADADIRRLKVRVRPSGLKTFIYDYQLPGQKQRTVQVGPIGIGVVKARAIAATLEARVRLGQDVAAERDRAREKVDDTFGLVAKQYLEFKRGEMAPRSLKNEERYLLNHAAPLHSRSLGEISKRDIATMLGNLTFTGKHGNGRATHNQVGAAIGRMFGWAMSKGIVEANPAVDITKYALQARSRVLKLDELRDIWLALADDDFGRIMRLLALTAQRANEIAGLQRSELQGDRILLSAARVKNRREHSVSLSPAAYEIIQAQLAQRPDRELLFGRRGEAAFANWGRAKRDLDERIARQRGEPLAPWRVHDLRRSAITIMNEIGINPWIVEAIANHRGVLKSGTGGAYNYARYESEKRAALNRWAEYLLAVIEGRDSNVVSLQRGT